MGQPAPDSQPETAPAGQPEEQEKTEPTPGTEPEQEGKEEQPESESEEPSIRPLADKVIIKAIQPDEKSAGGIYLPAGSELPDQGIVFAAGPGKYSTDGTFIPTEVSPGDRVIFNKHTGVDIQIGSVSLIVLKEEHVLCII